MSPISPSESPFWEKDLAALNEQEWEALCDGCGRCCLKKLQDEDEEKIFWTRIVCRYFDQHSHRCTCYGEREQLVPECLNVKQMDILANIHWMPVTCAYRLRAEDKPLPEWHPLLSGSRKAMEDAGIAIGGQVLSEEYVHPDGLGEHIIRWVES